MHGYRGPVARDPAATQRRLVETWQMSRIGKGTTAIGFTSRRNQTVVRETGIHGTDHGQTIYVLRCNDCGHEYGANGSDIFQRKCPSHDGGAPGLEFQISD